MTKFYIFSFLWRVGDVLKCCNCYIDWSRLRWFFGKIFLFIERELYFYDIWLFPLGRWRVEATSSILMLESNEFFMNNSLGIRL